MMAENLKNLAGGTFQSIDDVHVSTEDKLGRPQQTFGTFRADK